MNLVNDINALVNKALEPYPALFLIKLNITPDNVIKVIIDGDNGVGIDDCVNISRAIEGQIDEETDFSLEVTSFGAEEPFVVPRQYQKNVGRTVQITTTDGKVQEGVLKGEVDGVVTLETETREPKPVGKGKITVKKEHSFALSDIKEAKVIIKF